MKKRKFFIQIFSLFIVILFSTNVHGNETPEINGDGNITGDGNVTGNNNNNCPAQILKSVNSNINLNCSNLGRAATIDNNPVLLLKEVKDTNEPGTSISDFNNHLGLVESGAKVRVVAETEPDIVFHKFTKIEILEGALQGNVGWVLSSRIQISNVSE